MSKPLVVVSCPIDSFSGYGARSRDIVKALFKIGKYDVKVLPQRWGSTPYGALDENPKETTSVSEEIQKLYNNFEQSSVRARELMKENPEYIYFTNLGHKYYFEHTTTADKFIYEMELRTGVGAHYKYAEHCRKALELWYQKYPNTRGLIFEGSAEPE